MRIKKKCICSSHSKNLKIFEIKNFNEKFIEKKKCLTVTV